MTSTFTLCGRRGTYGIGSGGALGPEWPGWPPRLLAWQAWHFETRHPPWFHVAGVVLGDIDLHFVWQAGHVWHWAGSGGARGPEWPGWPPRLLAWQARHFATSTFVSRGRRCTWWHRPSLCVAGVARMALGWLRWRAWAGVARVAAAAVGVAGTALCDIHLRFTWQALYLVTSTFTLCGRRGTYGIGLALWWHTHTHTHLTHTTYHHTELTLPHTTYINLLHPNPSPSLFSFLLSPCHLYLSFAACWKKLTCGVIRSFNFSVLLQDFLPSTTELLWLPLAGRGAKALVLWLKNGNSAT